MGMRTGGLNFLLNSKSFDYKHLKTVRTHELFETKPIFLENTDYYIIY